MSEQQIIHGLTLNRFKEKDISNWSNNLANQLTENEIIAIFCAIYSREISINYGIVRNILAKSPQDFDYDKIFTEQIGISLAAKHYLLLIGKSPTSIATYFMPSIIPPAPAKTLQNFIPEFITNYFPSGNNQTHYMEELDEKILLKLIDVANLPSILNFNTSIRNISLHIGQSSLKIILDSCRPSFISKITHYILLNYQNYTGAEATKLIDLETANRLCSNNTFFGSIQPTEWIGPMLNAFQNNAIPLPIFINFFNSCFVNGNFGNGYNKETCLNTLITKTAQDFITVETASQLLDALNGKTLDIKNFIGLIFKCQNASLSHDFFHDLHLTLTEMFDDFTLEQFQNILHKFSGETINIGNVFLSLISGHIKDDIVAQITDYLSTSLQDNQNQAAEQSLVHQNYNFETVQNSDNVINYVTEHQGIILADELCALNEHLTRWQISFVQKWTNTTATNFFSKFSPGIIDNRDLLIRFISIGFSEPLENETLITISKSIKTNTIDFSCANNILPAIFYEGYLGKLNNSILINFSNIFATGQLPINFSFDVHKKSILNKNTKEKIKLFDILFQNGFESTITVVTLKSFLSAIPNNSLNYQATIQIYDSQSKIKEVTFSEFISQQIEGRINEDILLLIANKAEKATLDLYENFIPEKFSFPTFCAVFSKINTKKNNNIVLLQQMTARVNSSHEQNNTIQSLNQSITQTQNELQRINAQKETFRQQLESDLSTARNNIEKFKQKNQAKLKSNKNKLHFFITETVSSCLSIIWGALSIPFSVLTFGASLPFSVGLITSGLFLLFHGSHCIHKSRKKIKKCNSYIKRSDEVLNSQTPENIRLDENEPNVLRTYLEFCRLRSQNLNQPFQQPQRQPENAM